LKTTPTALYTLRSLPAHRGHTVSASSVKLWNWSNACPHSVQRYWYVGNEGILGLELDGANGAQLPTRTGWHSPPATANGTAQ
jgi:hypothetical protein